MVVFEFGQETVHLLCTMVNGVKVKVLRIKPVIVGDVLVCHNAMYLQSASCIPIYSLLVDGRLTEWSEWSACNASCAGGTRFRRRECIPPKRGGKPCESDKFIDYEECNTQNCPG